MPSPTAEMFERLVRLETKLDMFLEQLAAERQRAADHETRIRKVERWQYALPPTVVLALLAAASELLR